MIRDKNFKLAQYAYNRWALNLEENETLDDLRNERFLSGQVDQIRGYDRQHGIGDIIEVRKRDTGMYAEAIITDIGEGYIRVDIIKKFEPKMVDVAASAAQYFVTRWNVGKQKHEVVRSADRYVMATDFATRERAVEWINRHMQVTSKTKADLQG